MTCIFCCFFSNGWTIQQNYHECRARNLSACSHTSQHLGEIQLMQRSSLQYSNSPIAHCAERANHSAIVPRTWQIPITIQKLTSPGTFSYFHADFWAVKNIICAQSLSQMGWESLQEPSFLTVIAREVSSSLLQITPVNIHIPSGYLT
jgi:hypothetical protein